MHFSVLQWRKSTPLLKHAVQHRLFQCSCISNMSQLKKSAENFWALETSISETSGRRATKLLQLRPCKTSVVDALKEHDPVARIHFCNWFLQSVYDGEVDPQLVFSLVRPGFPYVETWILRTAGTGVQKIQDLFTNSLFMTTKTCVWCAVSARREISTISGQELLRVNNVLRWYTDCIRSRGQPFQHLL
jgi:hypothetical protein